MQVEPIPESPEVIRKVDKSLYYITSSNIEYNSTEKRPLLMLFSWSGAKMKQAQKYTSMFTSQGFDALLALNGLPQCLPVGSRPMARRVIRFCQERDEAKDRPIVVYTLSVGGFVFGMTMHVLEKEDRSFFAYLKSHIRAMVCDSILLWEDVPQSFAATVTLNSCLKPICMSIIYHSFSVFLHTMSPTYKRVQRAFEKAAIAHPPLYCTSTSDEFAKYGTSSTNYLMALAKANGQEKATVRFWDDTPHVLLLQYHPEEYRAAVYAHLNSVGFDVPSRKEHTPVNPKTSEEIVASHDLEIDDK